ncbi:MAG TPA: diguanylate cyclase [Tahibacter sp.]|uniref:sensor domain-containing diguanylate cyclase n=1 Tax=Tahibacter sp. TaxID=2056211 RepID=UPI002B8B9097|nr:diguanylate cyclase [Tahibacter sp.]HSX61161.1 diguanylate cyclase [Tahibacter sp.]
MPGNPHFPATAPTAGLSWTGADELGRRALLAEILAQVSREALDADGLEQTLQCIVDCLVRQLPVQIASILLLDEAGDCFVGEVWAGDLLLAPVAPGAWPVTKGASGRCARTGAAQLIEDTDNDPDYLPGHPNVRSEYLVPIRHRRRLLGVLNLESIERDFFTAPVRATFDAVATQIAGAIHLASVVRDLEAANQRLRELSLVDGLTGAANRRAFDLNLHETWARAAAAGLPLALLLLDADWFKLLNDNEGHPHGDDCLRTLAQICRDTVRTRDRQVARYGGEELAVLLPATGLAEAARIAEAVRLRVVERRMPHRASPLMPFVTVSIGVSATRPRPDRDATALVAAADRALYAAKRGGRNRIERRRCR